MSNEIKIKVTSEADTKAIDAANKTLAETAVVAYKASQETDKLGDNFTESDRKAERLGRTVASDRDQLIKLDAAIVTSTASLKLMAHALADTDDAAQRLDIKRAMGKVQSDLSSSLKAKKLLNIGELIDTEPDPSFISKLGSRLGSSLAGAPPLAIAGGVIGAALAPSIAAGIAGGITGAIGIGIIGGGIALIAKDPIIADKAKQIGSTFKKSITESARGALEGPVSDSLGKLEGLAARSAPKIGQAFQAVAPSVAKLTDNVTGLADSLTDDLVAAAGNSGPAIGALGDLLEHTGKSIGDMIKTLSEDAPEGASAINDLDLSLQNIIKTTTSFIDGLADIKGAADSFDGDIDATRNGIEDLFTSMSGGRAAFDITADGYKHGTEAARLYSEGVIGAKGATNDYAALLAAGGEQLDTFSKHTAGAEGATEAFAGTLDNASAAALGSRDALVALSNEMRAETDPVFGLLDATDQLKDAQKEYAKSVKKSGENSEDSKEKLRELAKAAITLENKAGALGGTFDGTVSPALRHTLEAAGLTGPMIDQLGKEFQDAKRKGDSFAKTYRAKFEVPGADSAAEKIRRAADAARKFRGTYTATIITNYRNIGQIHEHPGLATGGVAGAAANGNTSSGLTWVGENGPELAALDPGTRVWSNGDSKRMAAQGGGGGDVRLFLDPSTGASNALSQALFEMIRAEVRQQGGGSVQRTFGPVGAMA